MKYLLISLLLPLCIFSLSAQNGTYNGWIDKSVKYIENNRLDSAAIALQQAMRLDPANENNALLLLNLGILQRQLGLTDDAYISFTASLGNNPDPVLVLHNRASLLCDLGRFDEAMEDYNAIIGKDPTDVEAYYRRGLLFLEKNDRQSAEADFRLCEDTDPDNLFTKLSKALIFKLMTIGRRPSRSIPISSTQVPRPTHPTTSTGRMLCEYRPFFESRRPSRHRGGGEGESLLLHPARSTQVDQFDKFAAGRFRKGKAAGI